MWQKSTAAASINYPLSLKKSHETHEAAIVVMVELEEGVACAEVCKGNGMKYSKYMISNTP